MTTILACLLEMTGLATGVSGWGAAFLFGVLLKGTILLLFALALAITMRRASAASRHLVWTLALGVVLVLPVLSLTLPAWKVPILSSFTFSSAGNRVPIEGEFRSGPLNARPAQVPGGRQPVGPRWSGWILLLWMGGSALTAAWMVVGEVRVRRLTVRAQLFQTPRADSILETLRGCLHITRTVKLKASTEIDTPFTRGVFRPVILLPEGARKWRREQIEFVLSHELAHVYRHDCLAQVPAQVACALFWFHPLVWLGAFYMRKEREYACDDIVLSLGHKATDYAEFLLLMGRGMRRLKASWSTSVAMALPSQLEVRMKALLNSKLNHRPLTANRVLFAAVLTIAVLLPTAAIRATAKEAIANDGAANISGRVLESGKGGASGAKVTLVDSRTLKKLSTSTDKDGRFEFSDIPAGGFKLEITKPGFASIIIPGLVVAPSRNVVVYGNIGPLPEAKPSTPSQVVVQHRPQRIRVGGQVEREKLVYHLSPEYPPLAKAARIQGTVKLDAVIGKNGTVKDLKVLSGHPLLVKATLDAVKKWRFKPTLLNGVPVEVETTIEVNFGLAQKSDDRSGK